MSQQPDGKFQVKLNIGATLNSLKANYNLLDLVFLSAFYGIDIVL